METTKRPLKTVMALLAILFIESGKAQVTADFENLTLATDTFWNGSTSTPSVSTSSVFTSGSARFPNEWDGSFGGFWSKGWAYSNKTNTVSAGASNKYSAIASKGHSTSANYAVGQDLAVVKFTAVSTGTSVAGFYVTNSTYSYKSMQNGDQFAKKFGGSSGDDPDWFKLVIYSYHQGSLGTDSVEFYLADYRFTNNASDYIVKDWTYVNLLPLGDVDSLVFRLRSSDVGPFGYNTPLFFCLDHLTANQKTTTALRTHHTADALQIYPNPASTTVRICGITEADNVVLLDAAGNVLIRCQESVDVSGLSGGIYLLRLTDKEGTTFIKKLVVSK